MERKPRRNLIRNNVGKTLSPAALFSFIFSPLCPKLCVGLENEDVMLGLIYPAPERKEEKRSVLVLVSLQPIAFSVVSGRGEGGKNNVIFRKHGYAREFRLFRSQTSLFLSLWPQSGAPKSRENLAKQTEALSSLLRRREFPCHRKEGRKRPP